MSIAYVVLAHRDGDQIERLVRRLTAEGDLVFLHLDAKAPEELRRQLVRNLGDLPAVRLVDPVPVWWGDFSQVEATLRALADLQTSGRGYELVFLLTGQDYPLVPARVLRERVAAHPDRSYLHWFGLPDPRWGGRGGLDRLERIHHRLEYPRTRGRLTAWTSKALLRLLPRRRIPAGLRPFGGSAYWGLTPRCVDLILDTVARRPDWVRFFRRAQSPDELFFHTLLLNSELADTLENRSLHHVDWSRPEKPAVLGVADLPAMRASGAWFARKFDARTDPEVLDRIDRELLGLSPVDDRAPSR